jgi:hypothetical protein
MRPIELDRISEESSYRATSALAYRESLSGR